MSEIQTKTEVYDVIISHLQQRLALKDLENLRLKEALLEAIGFIPAYKVNNSVVEKWKQALSTPPQREDLDAYVEAKLGEPVAWALFYDNGIVHHVTKYVPPTMNGSHLGYKPLYTAPPQPSQF